MAAQLQDLAVPGLAGEGKMAITYEEMPVTLGDGTTLSLRKPTYSVDDLALRTAGATARRCRRASRRR